MIGEYFLVLASVLVLQPRSMQEPISTTMMVQNFWLKNDGSGCGESRTPLAKMRSGVVPCLAAYSSCISSLDRTHSGMRRGAPVHCVSPAAAERHHVSYQGSLDTSEWRMLRKLLGLGIGSSQSSCGMFILGGGSSSSSEVGDLR